MKKLSLLLLSACTPDGPITAPSPTPIEATPTPTPQPTPLHSFLFVPQSVPVGGSVFIYLCEPFDYGVKVFIDEKVLLGTFSKDLVSGCMKLFYPGFNQAGSRTITTRGYSAKIEIIDPQALK